MELEKERFRVEQKKGKASTQVTFDQVHNLPDYLPDFFSVILSRGSVRLEETKASCGQVFVTGAVKFQILYRTDQNEWKLSSLEGEIPFKEILNLEQADEFDQLQTEVCLEDLSVQTMNGRKINIRALMSIRVEAGEWSDVELPVLREEILDTQVKCEEQEYLELCYRGNEQCQLKEELKIPANKPNIRQILWQQVQILGTESRVQEGKLTLQGDVQIFVLYISEEDRLVWMDSQIPYACEISVTEAENGMIPYVKIHVQNTNCKGISDEDGENRKLSVEAQIRATVWLYQERRIPLIQDLYALDRGLILQKCEQKLPKLLMKAESKYRVGDGMKVARSHGDVMQICAGFGELEVDRKEFTPTGLQVDGVVKIQLLLITDNDSSLLEAMEGVLPFSCLMEIPDAREQSQRELQCNLESLSFMMKSNQELDVQAVIQVQALVTEQIGVEIIQGVQEEPLKIEDLNSQPGIVGITFSETDSLWEIAKKYHTTEAAIRKTNELGEQPLRAGTKLLLVKQLSPVQIF